MLCRALTAISFLLLAPSALAADIVGDWREVGARAVVRISPCEPAATSLCAILVETRADDAPARLAVSGLHPKGLSEWRGRYVLDGDALPATVKLRGPDHADMTACMFVLCKTVRYQRVAQ